MGKKTKQKLPLYKMYKSKIQDPKHVCLPPIDMSLSLMLYAQVSVCTHEEHISSIYTLFFT